MTLRELFTAAAASGLLAGTKLRLREHPSGSPVAPRVWSAEDLAEDAVAVADALVARLTGVPEPAMLRAVVEGLAAIPFGQRLDEPNLVTLIARARALVGPPAEEGGAV